MSAGFTSGSPDIGKSDIAHLYKSVLRIRIVEEKIARRYPEGKMRTPVHLSVGQEGVAVGLAAALKLGDQVFGSHRSHALYLAMGGSLDALIAELYGKATGCCGGVGGSMHIHAEEVGFMGAFPIVGDAIALATGAALAFKLSAAAECAIAVFGDAGPESGQFWESVNFAVLHHLPLLYVCEDNGYATQTPLAQRQPGIPLSRRLRHLLPVVSCDDQPERVQRAAGKCLSMLPALLHVKTYRFLKHVGVEEDGDMGYRPQAEIDAARERDFLRRWQKGHYTWDLWGRVVFAPTQELKLAFRHAEEAPWALATALAERA